MTKTLEGGGHLKRGAVMSLPSTISWPTLAFSLVTVSYLVTFNLLLNHFIMLLELLSRAFQRSRKHDCFDAIANCSLMCRSHFWYGPTSRTKPTTWWRSSKWKCPKLQSLACTRYTGLLWHRKWSMFKLTGSYQQVVEAGWSCMVIQTVLMTRTTNLLLTGWWNGC